MLEMYMAVVSAERGNMRAAAPALGLGNDQREAAHNALLACHEIYDIAEGWERHAVHGVTHIGEEVLTDFLVLREVQQHTTLKKGC